MKKLIVLVIMIACASMAFAQTNAVSLDVYPTIIGIDQSGDGWLHIWTSASFEHAMSQNLSIGGDLDFFLSSATGYSEVGFGLIGKARYYPASKALEGFFIGAGAGLGIVNITDQKLELGFAVEVETGYKIMFSSLFVEPSIAYSYGRWTGFDWKPCLRIGFSF